MRLQKQRRRHPGLAETNHQHAFIFEFHQVHFTTLRLRSGQAPSHRDSEKTKPKEKPSNDRRPCFPGSQRPMMLVSLFFCVSVFLCFCVSVFLCFCVCGESIYLNFSVVSANSANTNDAIQKRTIIFDSDHPINSK